MTSTITEFQVEMTCQKCVDKVSSILETDDKVSSFDVDLTKQSVVVTSSKSVSELQILIESGTGLRAVVAGHSGSAQNLGSAVAVLGGTVGWASDEKIRGVIRFTQISQDDCVIDGTIDGLSPGYHGLAIHESGDLSKGCTHVGGHYNPNKTSHGGPDDDERHVGDLGNVLAGSEGRASFKISNKLVKVWDVIGRSVVVSSDKDDYGTGNDSTSKLNGNCGSSLACGIIARSAGLFQNSKRFCACDGVSQWDERNKPLAGPGRAEIGASTIKT